MRGAKNSETKSLLQGRPIPLVIVAVAGALVSLLMLRWHTTDGLRWYQVVYRLIYRLGLIIWRRDTPPDRAGGISRRTHRAASGTCPRPRLRHGHRHHLPRHPRLGCHRR